MNKIFDKLRNNKYICIILIIGIMLMTLPFGEKKEEIPKNDFAYEEELTDKIEKILGEIEGAGRVKIMITFEDKGETYPVTDKNESSEKTVSFSGKMAVSKEEYPKVRGVVAVCEGVKDERVRTDLINAIHALTGAGLHNIKVFKMKK